MQEAAAMTVSMRVMSAGDGYKYLLRTVAAGDGDRSLSTPLTRYYAEQGSPPGRWVGQGLGGIGAGQLSTGDQVTEAQLQLLVGMGRDPITGDPLGRAYQSFVPVSERIDARVAELDGSLSPAVRAAHVAQIEAGETKRGTRRAVAGFDYTFSVPKSASVLWAVADAGMQALIAQAHHAAIAEVVAFIEREVATTRVGATGIDGAAAQVDVTGVIATAFDHYDSRAGDPHLHTHVVISNKVQTAQDGKWRSLDGRPMHAAVVALSELHEAVFADHMTRAFGVEWESRDMGRDRNPAWAISAVPEALVSEFSTRSRHIDVEKNRLIADYIEKHGKQPTTATILKLRVQATLATRPEKQVRSLAELTSDWRTRATRLLGQDATRWAQDVAVNLPAMLLRADDVPLDVIAEIGQAVVEVVGEKRSTWRRWNLHAEASRQLMGWRFASMVDREAVTGLVVDAAENASLRLTPPELASSPVVFQRDDGTSRFRPKHSTVYSSETLLQAEDRLLQRARSTASPTVALTTVEQITRRPDADGRMLSDDQATALASIAVSGRTIDVLVGAAGAGKTTAMNALRRAWETEYGAGTVVGLAPSAVAAEVLAEDLGIATENTAKWWHNHLTHGTTFTAGQLVIIDEASLAGTHSLDRITGLAEKAGAKVLLVGDYAQLQSVDAGGAFALLAGDRDDAPELIDIHRFNNEWEKTASLDLRHGRTDIIDTYLDHDRIHDGDEDTMTDAAYAAWREDTAAGLVSVLIAETNETVTALNNRARADLILDGALHPIREVEINDGPLASVGDTIITRRNDRRLRTKDTWVRNGARWKINQVRHDAPLTARDHGRRFGGAIVLPAAYVAGHVDLGYAVTAHRAQGITTDTAHGVVSSPEMTRESFYVAMTRGRESNRAYIATDQHHLEEHQHRDDLHMTARSILYGVLQHVGAELSAHDTITAEQETWGSLAQLAAEYETIAQEAQQHRWTSLLEQGGLTIEVLDELVETESFGILTTELRRLEAAGHDLEQLLPRVVQAGNLDGVDDLGSLLRYRIQKITSTYPPSPRRAGGLIAELVPRATGATDPAMRAALAEREHLMGERLDALTQAAIEQPAPWLPMLGGLDHESLQQMVRVVAAYRDRWGITSTSALGPVPADDAQRIDYERTRDTLTRLSQAPDDDTREVAQRRGERRL